jgi:hypothetical protein
MAKDEKLEDEKLIAPYLEWAVLTNFAYLHGDWFRVLLELNEPAASFASAVDSPGFMQLIRVPSIYQMPSREFKKDDVTFCMALMTREALTALLIGKGAEQLLNKLSSLRRSLKRLELGTPAASPFGRSPTTIPLPLAASQPQAAVVAVIDDGLAFANERFRFANGTTRFKYFWNQDDTTGINTPPGFGWGRELTQGQINALLASCTHAGIVDEDTVYRQAGQNLAARHIKHGTHVMDIACGLDPKDVTPESPYLIGVQLPKWVTEETSGTSLTPAVYNAITYILSRADQIAAAEQTAPLPVVVNVSYGTIAGPHDGTGQFEAAIDQLVELRASPLRVVLPAGNHYLARCHANFNMADAASPNMSATTLHWRVQPDDKANSFMEIWLPEFAADNKRSSVAIRITTPTGDSSPWIQPGGDWPWPSSADVRFDAHYYDPAGGRPWIRLAMAPTTELSPNPRTAPSGTWLIEVLNKGGAITVDAWVQRGDTPFGYPLWGRQSRFDDGEYVRFDLAGRPQQDDIGPSYIRRLGSINALATGQRAIVIGGFRRSDSTASEYSGAGPVATPATIPPPRTGPDAAAVADDSVALHGILAAGTRTGSVVAMSGTSIAAPQVTRMISKLMTTSLASDRAAVQGGAAAGDPRAPAPGSTLGERIGAGRINAPPRIRR